MIKIFTTEQLKEIDKYTIANEPIRPIDLVERAAKAFVDEFSMRYNAGSRVTVFAGQGNNGADALTIAQMLSISAFHVEAYLFNPPSGKLSAECETIKRRLIDMQISRQVSEYKLEFVEVAGGEFFPPSLKKGDILVDGLFGTGLNRPLEGGFAAIVKYINASEATVVSIDIPSGLFGEDNSGNRTDAIVRADLTISFGFPKLSFLLPDFAEYAGKWKVTDIGLHHDIITALPTPFLFTEEEDVANMLMPRPKFAHKGTFGHALLIAGSREKLGAALLSARACLRSGAGMLTVHLPSCGEYVFQTAFPEAMLSLDTCEEHIATLPDLHSFSAVGAGPALGKDSETAVVLQQLLKHATCPIVLDADALNIIAADKSLFDHLPHRSILTPHPKEFDRLAGESANAYERLKKASSLAVERSIVIVLKGAHSAVCTPDGNIYFNCTGNSGMATAGSGDVLTGIILGLLAAGYKPVAAAILGVYLHGMAGDLALAGRSEEALLASDITESIGRAFKQLKI